MNTLRRHKTMRLSNNFTLAELTKSQTAARRGIDNEPNQEQIENLQQLVLNVLQPIRDAFARPVTVNSGFRCLELNRAIGSRDNSQHTKGMAADIEIHGVSNFELAEWIQNNLDFDQLILEFWLPEEGGNSGWVHVSYVSPEANRRQSLTINKYGAKLGLG